MIVRNHPYIYIESDIAQRIKIYADTDVLWQEEGGEWATGQRIKQERKWSLNGEVNHREHGLKGKRYTHTPNTQRLVIESIVS